MIPSRDPHPNLSRRTAATRKDAWRFSPEFQSPNLSLPQGLSRAQLTDREALRRARDGHRRNLDRGASMESFDRHRQAAISPLAAPRVQRAASCAGGSGRSGCARAASNAEHDFGVAIRNSM